MPLECHTSVTDLSNRDLHMPSTFCYPFPLCLVVPSQIGVNSVVIREVFHV